MRFFAYLAYDGTFFHGFAKQPRFETVEKVLREVIKPFGLDLLKYASRTDRGVHAVSQLLLLELRLNKFTFDLRDLVISLNSELPECMFLYGYVPNHKNYDLRAVIKHKEYLYIAPDFGENRSLIDWAINYLNAKEHDFSALSKKSKSNEKVIRRIKVNFAAKGDFQYFRFVSKGFMWEQVRRTVTAIKALALGKISFRDFINLLNGKSLKKGIAPAPPEGLILMRIATRLNGWRFIIDRKIIKEFIRRKTEIYTASLSKSWVLP